MRTLTRCLQRENFVEYSNTVVLNRGYTYHLGVRGAKAGGMKHQRICDTMWTTLVTVIICLQTRGTREFYESSGGTSA